MCKVFVVEPTNLDVRKASRFGCIVQVFEDNDSRSSIWDEAFKVELIQALDYHGFDPATDYLLVAGGFVPLALAIGTMVAEYGPIQVLLFSATERDYVPRITGDEVMI